jgi:hypothetical protein
MNTKADGKPAVVHVESHHISHGTPFLPHPKPPAASRRTLISPRFLKSNERD